MQLVVGTIVDDKYELIAPIGSGGMGTVYKAKQRGIDRLVAVKMIAPLCADNETYARFEREARAISCLHHKNIVAFYGYGKWRSTPYMVMELIDGVSLQSLLSNNEALEAIRCLQLAKQILAGLHAAHLGGVVHRDLKPSNVMLVQSEGNQTAKIIDFGLAKLLGPDSTDQKLTEVGVALGTVLYMSPEQCTGHAADPRSDIYAAGCILFHCLTGAIPFDGDQSVVVMNKHLNEQPPAVRLDGTPKILNDGVNAFLQRCLAKSPDDRYQTAEEAAADLDKLLQGQAVPSLVPLTAVSRGNQPRSKNRSRTMLAVASLALCSILGGLVVMKNNESDQAQTHGPSSIDLFNDLERKSLVQEPPPREQIPVIQRILAANQSDHMLDAVKLSRLYGSAISNSNDIGSYRNSIVFAKEAIAVARMQRWPMRFLRYPLCGYGDALSDLHQNEQAASMYQQFIDQYPTERETNYLRLGLARAFVSLRRPREAEKVLKETKPDALEGGASEVCDTLCDAYSEQRRYADALAEALKMAYMRESYPGGHALRVSEFYLRLNNLPKALEYIKMSEDACKAVDKHPYVVALLQRQVIALKQGHAQEAIPQVLAILRKEASRPPRDRDRYDVAYLARGTYLFIETMEEMGIKDKSAEIVELEQSAWKKSHAAIP